MKEDAKEAREKAKTEQENAIRKRKEEREELEKRIAESRNEDTDIFCFLFVMRTIQCYQCMDGGRCFSRLVS